MYIFFSKLAYWIFFNQLTLIIILINVSFIFYSIKKNQFSKYFLIIIFLYFFIIAILPTGNILMYSLEKKYVNNLPDNIDGILVLSGGEDINRSIEYNQIYANGSNNRILESLALQKKFPEVKIIYSGASHVFPKVTSKTYVAEKFYNLFSANLSNVVFESESRNTYQSILNSCKLFKVNDNETWILLTSAFHIPRAIAVAEKINCKLIPHSVDYRSNKKFLKDFLKFNLIQNIIKYQFASHEYIGLLIYKIFGRS